MIALWMYAAESGRNIIKTDKMYLYRYCRLLKEPPDLEPLLNAVDDFGRPNPFIRYCDASSNCDTSFNKDQDISYGSSKKRGRKSGLKNIAGNGKNASDQLYKNALKIAAYYGYISARKLQLKLKIGNIRAKSIIQTMSENRLLGDYIPGKGIEYLTVLEKINTEKIREEEIREESDSYRNPEEKREKKEKTNFKGKEQNRKKRSPENMQAEAQRQKQELLQAETDNSGRTPVNPLNPMESDETAVNMHYVPKQPSSAYRDGKIIHIGNVLAERFPEHWNDADAESFGWEIVEALGYSTDRENVQSRAEWGSFASWWKRVKQTASPIAYQELRTIAIDKAIYVRTKAKSAKNKSAVWFTIMNKELSTRGITLPDSRASPA